MEIGLIEILTAVVVLLVVLGILYYLLQSRGEGELLELAVELID